MERLLKRLLPESLKARSRRWRARSIALLARRTNLTRDPLAQIFLRGNGLEVGPLNWPLDVPKGSRSLYADALPLETLRAMYPESKDWNLRVDVVAPVETLAGIEDASQDYAIANHVIEHSEDPIQAIASLLRVLKPGGILFFALPDKRFTFDVERPVTPFEHILRDYREGPEWSRLDHYREFARLVEHVPEDEVEPRAQHMLRQSSNIHYHAWTQMEMLEAIVRLKVDLGFPIEVEAVSKTGIEAIFVLRKTGE